MNYLKIIIPLSLLLTLYFVFENTKETSSEERISTNTSVSSINKPLNYKEVFKESEKKVSILEEINIQNELKDFEAKSSKLILNAEELISKNNLSIPETKLSEKEIKELDLLDKKIKKLNKKLEGITND